MYLDQIKPLKYKISDIENLLKIEVLYETHV